MTYGETLDYLFAQLPMYHRIGPAAYKNDLTNTLKLCAHLGNPERKFPSIHVAGTNGKGSVSHMLASVLQAAGYKTGLYISPHYKDFRERIKINGEYIPRRQVIDFVEVNRSAIEEIQPSFFEMTVGMAFDFFAREGVDIAVVEVGLGGRLDSTNVIMPLVSVITNISFDHTALLGNTLPKIAGEKAGIIKPGVPVVIGETQPETMPVFREKAAAAGAALFVADENFRVVECAVNLLIMSQLAAGQIHFDVFKQGKIFLGNLELDAAGSFQAKNLTTALQTIEVLKSQIGGKLNFEKTLTEAALRTGLAEIRARTNFMGRWQTLGQNPLLLADSAHNEAGLREAFSKIKSLNFKHLHLVTGFVNDKDVRGVLPLFPKNARYYFAKADIPRGLPAGELRDLAAEFGLHGKAYSSVKNALRAARRAAGVEDLVLVIGSIFVVGEVL